MVQEQLAENRKAARERRRGAAYLLQGLIVCNKCHYAFYGKPVRNKRKQKIDRYAYYRCIGTDGYRFGGDRVCNNKQIRTDTLEIAVWEEVKILLNDPNRILAEYQRRIAELGKGPEDQTSDVLEKQSSKLKRGIARLIDSYTKEYIDKEDFEPGIKAMKQNLQLIEEQKNNIIDQKKLRQDLTLIITNLEEFSVKVRSNLEDIDWITKRDIIRTVVKRIEINEDEVNVVFRIRELPNIKNDNNGSLGGGSQSLQHCCRSNDRSLCEVKDYAK